MRGFDKYMLSMLNNRPNGKSRNNGLRGGVEWLERPGNGESGGSTKTPDVKS